MVNKHNIHILNNLFHFLFHFWIWQIWKIPRLSGKSSAIVSCSSYSACSFTRPNSFKFSNSGVVTVLLVTSIFHIVANQFKILKIEHFTTSP